MKNKQSFLKNITNYRQLVEHIANSYTNQIAFRYKGKNNDKEITYIEKTYQQFTKDIKSFATSLLTRGFQGKRIAVIGNNRYEWCVTYLAVTCGNMVIVPLDKALPDNEIASLIERSEAEAVVFDAKYTDIMQKLKENPQTALHTLICMDEIENTLKDIQYFHNILQEGKEELENGSLAYENVKLEEKEMSIMLFTSGTTNMPKAVMLSQYNICSNFCAYYTHFRLFPTDTLLSFLPIHHTFECSITFLYGIYCGVTIAFCDGLKYIQKNLKEYGVTVFVAVPLVMETMYKKIVKTIDEQGKTKLIHLISKISNTLLKVHIDIRKSVFKQILDNFGGKLRVVLYGGASIDKDTVIGLNNFGIQLIQGYGLTETSPVIAAESETRKKPGSVGYPLDNVEVKIENLDIDGIGEIYAKGPNIMLGYYHNEEKTKDVLVEGWFKTGDYGYFDKQGYLYITGRKNDIIVLKNGKNVYPQEIEFLINKLPYVEESLVYLNTEQTNNGLLSAKIVYNKDIMESLYKEKTIENYHNIIWEDIKETNKLLPTFKHIQSIIITSEPMIKTTTQKVKREEELKRIHLTQNEKG
ncbi:MAG: AMP-dependent synthetase/ligase [Clostridia bacterium]